MPDLVEPANGASENDVASTHGGVAVLVKWMSTARPAVHRSVAKPVLADGAEPAVPSFGGRGRRRVHALGLRQGPI
eukprot:1644432-Lingulodinium_polyedra.AAC.1